MRTIIFLIVISFSFVHIANGNVIENENKNSENMVTLVNLFDTDNQETELPQSQSYVHCSCAQINNWFARLIGIGNNRCLATNSGTYCGGGENFDCQSLNSNCGGNNPESQ